MAWVQSWAARRTLHDLQRSVSLGRPLSLPNFLRLYRRRCEGSPQSQDLLSLKQLYFDLQPF